MSQYVVTEGNIEWVYGWDQPLMSFYLQKKDLTLDEEDQIVVWLGAKKDSQMYEVENLVAAGNRHGLRIPYEMQVKLYGDKDEGR